MTRKRTSLQVVAAAALLSALACLGVKVHRSLDYNSQYETYIRAAIHEDDPVKSVAKAEHALAYLENQGMTGGRTAILYDSPDTDVGDWYSVVSAAINDYKTSGGKDKVSLKKAVFGDPGADTEKAPIPAPTGIAIHPNNRTFLLWGWGSLVGAISLLGLSFLTTNTPKQSVAKAAPVTPNKLKPGSQPGFYICGNMPHVIYLAVDHHIHDLWWNGKWNDLDLNVNAGQDSLYAAGDPLPIVINTQQRVIFRGQDNCMHEFSLDYTSQAKWQYTNLTSASGAPLALS